MNRNVGVPGEFQHLAGIGGCVMHRHVARHADHAQHVETGGGEGEHDGNRIVLPRIGINDDLARVHDNPVLYTVGRWLA